MFVQMPNKLKMYGHLMSSPISNDCAVTWKTTLIVAPSFNLLGRFISICDNSFAINTSLSTTQTKSMVFGLAMEVVGRSVHATCYMLFTLFEFVSSNNYWGLEHQIDLENVWHHGNQTPSSCPEYHTLTSVFDFSSFQGISVQYAQVFYLCFEMFDNQTVLQQNIFNKITK